MKYYAFHHIFFHQNMIAMWWVSLYHWGTLNSLRPSDTYICIGNLTIVGSDHNGRRQAIIWTNAGILSIGPLGTNFSKTSIEIRTFSFKKMHMKMSSVKWRPFCFGLNVLMCDNRPIWYHNTSRHHADLTMTIMWHVTCTSGYNPETNAMFKKCQEVVSVFFFSQRYHWIYQAFHDDVIKWKHFHVTGLLWRKYTGHRWIPITKASNAELWRFLWSVLEQTIEQTSETPVIWDDIAPIMTSL